VARAREAVRLGPHRDGVGVIEALRLVLANWKLAAIVSLLAVCGL
jgi:hypothetical protein